MHDRYDHSLAPARRTVEQLKQRYYGAAAALLRARQTAGTWSPELERSPHLAAILHTPYNYE